MECRASRLGKTSEAPPASLSPPHAVLLPRFLAEGAAAGGWARMPGEDSKIKLRKKDRSDSPCPGVGDTL